MQHEHGNTNYCYYVIIVPIAINTCMSSSKLKHKINKSRKQNNNNGTDNMLIKWLNKNPSYSIESKLRFSFAVSSTKSSKMTI